MSSTITADPVLEAFTAGFGYTLLIILGFVLLAIVVGVVRRLVDV